MGRLTIGGFSGRSVHVERTVCHEGFFVTTFRYVPVEYYQGTVGSSRRTDEHRVKESHE